MLEPYQLPTRTWLPRWRGFDVGHTAYALTENWGNKDSVKLTFNNTWHLYLVRGHDSSHDSSIWAYIDKSGINELQDYNQPIDHDTWSPPPSPPPPRVTTYKLETTKRNLELKTTCLMPPHNMSFSQAERHGMAWHVPFGETGKSLFTGSR